MARKATDYIIIHCSATKPSHNVDIKDIDRWHREQGWRMVGYHFLIKRDGTVQEGRGLMEGGAHAKGYNERSIGICLAGGICGGEACEHEHVSWASGQKGKPENNYTLRQWEALEILVSTLKEERFPDADVIGHNDVEPGKACPCFDVKTWWNQVNN